MIRWPTLYLCVAEEFRDGPARLKAARARAKAFLATVSALGVYR
jgi:hypothetical protein